MESEVSEIQAFFPQLLQAFADVSDLVHEYNPGVPNLGSLATLTTGDTRGPSLSDSYLSLEKAQHESRDSAARLGVLALRWARRRGSRARFERGRRIHRDSQTEGNWRGDKLALSGAGGADPGGRHGAPCR